MAKKTTQNRLRALWEKTRYRPYLPGNWWKRWRLSQNYELSFVHLKDMQIAIASGVVPDCENCLEVCCAGPNSIVSLRLSDIARLVDAGLEDYIVRPRLAASPRQLSQHLLSNKNGFDQMFPTLLRDESGTCSLLGKNLSCQAYPNWPISCARYPYALDVVRHIVFFAGGCKYRKKAPSDPRAVSKARYLAHAAVECYNERIKDIIMLSFAEKELTELGLTKYLVKHN